MNNNGDSSDFPVLGSTCSGSLYPLHSALHLQKVSTGGARVRAPGVCVGIVQRNLCGGQFEPIKAQQRRLLKFGRFWEQSFAV